MDDGFRREITYRLSAIEAASGKLRRMFRADARVLAALLLLSTPAGAQQMTVANPNGTSSSYNITVNKTQPGLLAPASFAVGGKQYVVAQFADGTFVMPPNAIAPMRTRFTWMPAASAATGDSPMARRARPACVLYIHHHTNGVRR